jgi:hypothetical protein
VQYGRVLPHRVYQLVRTKKACVLCVLPDTLLSLPLPLLLRVKLLAAAAVVNILKLRALSLRDLHCTHIHTKKENTLLLGKTWWVVRASALVLVLVVAAAL